MKQNASNFCLNRAFYKIFEKKDKYLNHLKIQQIRTNFLLLLLLLQNVNRFACDYWFCVDKTYETPSHSIKYCCRPSAKTRLPRETHFFHKLVANRRKADVDAIRKMRKISKTSELQIFKD